MSALIQPGLDKPGHQDRSDAIEYLRIPTGQEVIDRQRRALRHAPRAATGAEASPFTAKGDQVPGAARLAAHPRKAVLQPTAFEVFLERALHLAGQFTVLLG